MGGSTVAALIDMSLQKYILDLQQFNLELPDVLKTIIKKNEQKIVGLVRTRLYQRGVDGDGNEITPSYAGSTIRAKKEKGQRTSHVTLRDTGLFYKGFYLELEGYNLVLDSRDGKTSFLVEKYGPAILFFTADEKQQIFNIVDNELDKIINKLPFNSGSAGTIDILDIYS